MKVGIIGAGNMGCEIAISAAVSGCQTILYNYRNIETTKERFNKKIERYKNKGLIDKERDMDIQFSVDLHDLKDCDLVIEAVVEDIQVKKKCFADLEEICSSICVFASNTSTYPIKDIFSDIKNKERCIALHYFNPAFIMKLVEIAYIEETKDEYIDIAKDFVRTCNKESVIVKDSAGFIVNKMFCSMVNNGIKIYEKGFASAEDIDKAMKFGLNHPMGPLALADLVGLDVFLDNVKVLYEYHGDEQYKPAEILYEKVQKGELGRKTKKGFYEY